MSWWKRRKSDPPVGSKFTITEPTPPKGAASEPPGAASEPPVFTPGTQQGSNIVSFPDPKNKNLSDANRAAVHALLDQLLDQIGPDEYLVMGIEEPE